LEEDHPQGLHSFNGRDLLTELEERHECVVGVENERAAEAVTLSRSVMGISYSLVNLGAFPIQDIPKRLKSAQDVLTAVGLVLERIYERNMPPTPILGSKRWLVWRLCDPRLSRLLSFLLHLVLL
jgi:hypothetical protein